MKELEDIKVLKNLADKLQVSVETLVMFAGFLVVLLVALNVGSYLLSSVVGFLYPSYMSFKAIKSH